ncbi:hypothetical protein [Nocardioides sp. R-C-SC26]|uniref:hypothetical protein n=1 Tax=Nocardioides sp. R-C-SC26 TaxID=2870414 RepID=UPI001E3B8471|nr:hypothetical protein [Nocardioides sp. R-C-SC26]
MLWLLATDPLPDDEDVVAGWTAFGLFGLGVLAIVILGFSLVTRLRNVDRAAEAGLYDPSTKRPARRMSVPEEPEAPGASGPAGSASAADTE